MSMHPLSSRLNRIVQGFAGLELLPGVIGLDGVIAAPSVSQRAHEVGTHMAPSADRGSVFQLILREALASGVQWLP